jgi:hypothetical protein
MAGYADPPKEHQFQPGQTGNAGGMSRELRAQIAANTEKATRIRTALLDAQIARLEAGESLDNDSNTRDLVKTSEDRGLGAPKTTTEIGGPDGGPVQLTGIAVEFVRPDPSAKDT